MQYRLASPTCPLPLWIINSLLTMSIFICHTEGQHRLLSLVLMDDKWIQFLYDNNIFHYCTQSSVMILKDQTRLDLAAEIYFFVLTLKGNLWLEVKRGMWFSHLWKRSTSTSRGSHPPRVPSWRENLLPVRLFPTQAVGRSSPFKPFSVFNCPYCSQQWV